MWPPLLTAKIPTVSKNSFGAKTTLEVSGKNYEIFDLTKLKGSETLPFSLKILLENLLRTEDGANITANQIEALASWNPNSEPDTEIQFTPARVIMQDFTGVPCVVDLATMREAISDLGGDPKKVNPLAPAELVIDHSVIADVFGTKTSFEENTDIEYQRNKERYRFLRWGQTAFDEFKVVPPGTGIVHQVNIEYLARVVMTRTVGGALRAYPDTVVGTDSHTTMVNGLGVLGWGVGGIEAEAARLADRVAFFTKCQWILDDQFAAAQARAKAAGMSAGIVHDLAVGVHPDGADSWALQDVLAKGINVGCPPDMFNQLGQDWSQPPWRPDALVETGYAAYRDMLRTILRHAGGIRVDHALGLFRLWWIPLGEKPFNGTFVRYDHEAMVGILALEAMRAGAFVVAEDLGTVEAWIQQYLASRGMLGTSILWFEHNEHGAPLEPERFREMCFATVTVHDLPPTAGMWQGEHIRVRDELHLLARPVGDERADWNREQASWLRALRDHGFVSSASEPDVQEVVEGLHRYLAATSSTLLSCRHMR